MTIALEMIDERVRIQSSPLNLFGFFLKTQCSARVLGELGKRPKAEISVPSSCD